MLFRNRNKATNIKIIIKNCTKSVAITKFAITRVTITKFLGTVIDESLNWKEHINLLKIKLSETVSIEGRCKHIFHTLFYHI